MTAVHELIGALERIQDDAESALFLLSSVKDSQILGKTLKSEEEMFEECAANLIPEFQHDTYSAHDVEANVKSTARSIWLAALVYARQQFTNRLNELSEENRRLKDLVK